METLDQYLENQLKNPKFKKEWDALDDEYQIIQNIVEARVAAHMTQMQLSELTVLHSQILVRLKMVMVIRL